MLARHLSRVEDISEDRYYRLAAAEVSICATETAYSRIHEESRVIAAHTRRLGMKLQRFDRLRLVKTDVISFTLRGSYGGGLSRSSNNRGSIESGEEQLDWAFADKGFDAAYSEEGEERPFRNMA